ncbi:hypothetical protein HCB26_06305 [Listeria booriae]|uniref:Uncharacterized protein n=1 Tax=Listeria booriae TaxID=1552123 RepID=A0A7X1D4X4_9LIST|nr:hypothetical protein [Listeria booriae]MBC2166178.1 hypothetical protein [Listeria booriae]
MKTSEFKTILNEMDLAVYEWESAFIITEDELNWDIANVSKDYERIMSIEENAYEAIGSEQTCELFELLTAYASTPIAEREEPKKYYVKCPITGQYLNKSEGENKALWWSNAYGNESNKFTREEIESFARKRDYLIEEEVTR